MKSGKLEPRSRRFSTLDAVLTVAVTTAVLCAVWYLAAQYVSGGPALAEFSAGPTGSPASATKIEKLPCSPPATSWIDRDGRTRPAADLNDIEAQHYTWVSSKKQKGEKADFSAKPGKPGADLSCMDMHGLRLQGVDLTGANLSGADLSGADLKEATGGIDQFCAADPDCARTNLTRTILDHAQLQGSDFTGATLIKTSLIDAQFDGDSDLSDVDLSGTVFEPKNFPETDITELAEPAKNLWRLTYSTRPGSLTHLQAEFHSDGDQESERQIIYAVQHTKAKHEWQECSSGGKKDPQPPAFGVVASDCLAAPLNTLIFDLPFAYGMNPSRPLYIVITLWLFCSSVYVAMIKARGRSAINLVCRRNYRDGSTIVRKAKIAPRPLHATTLLGRFREFLGRESALWRVATFFSLVSALNLGFEGLDLGRWLQMLTTRDYDLEAGGWARTVSGAQSLVSLAMLALGIWGLFGLPFSS